MKIKIALFLVFLLSLGTQAQDKKPKSPAMTEKGSINGAEITINYGSPSVKGREIWGKLVPFGKVWRAGANDATTFETNQNIKIEGKELPAGKYSFFIIPEKDSVTIIFNTEAKQWGAYDYNEQKDQLRINVKPKNLETPSENLVYSLTDKMLNIKWDNWIIPVSLK
ncbi:MAG: hypothetical protein ACI9XR_002748 [Flavobacterium sp.]|jgi:hypothetical protein